MKKYEYGRIARLAENLKKAEVPNEIIAEIMKDGEKIKMGTAPDKKADWLREAMYRMNKLLDKETAQSVREDCACCLGGWRNKRAQEISKHTTLEGKIKAANEGEKKLFGNDVVLQKDGSIRVRFFPEGLQKYQCVCLRQAKKPLPILYCYCCGGHVKHHLQNALDVNLKCKAESSALSSGGKKNCIFVLNIE